MAHETYYEYDDNINLDNQNLYDYVQYADELNNLKFTPGPQNVDTFSNGVETFKSNNRPDDEDEDDNKNEKSKKHKLTSNFMFYSILLILFLIFAYFVFAGKLKCGNLGMSKTLEPDTLNQMSEDVGVGALRAIFVK